MLYCLILIASSFRMRIPIKKETHSGFSRISKIVKRVWLKPLPFSSFIPALKSRAIKSRASKSRASKSRATKTRATKSRATKRKATLKTTISCPPIYKRALTLKCCVQTHITVNRSNPCSFLSFQFSQEPGSLIYLLTTCVTDYFVYPGFVHIGGFHLMIEPNTCRYEKNVND
jgi:hypothetical protein